MTSLLETLTGATPPEPKGARAVRPLDGDDPIDRSPPPNRSGTDYKALAMNNKAASLRALLRDNPDGLNYDELCRYTGIARDRIGSHVAALITNGDAKAYELPGRGRIFKFSGDPKRVGPRVADQVPASASATPKSAPEPKTAAPQTSEPVLPLAPPSAAHSARAAAPNASIPVVDVPAEKWAKEEPAPPGAHPPLNGAAHALATDLVIIAAANLAAEVRRAVAAHIEKLPDLPELAAALHNFERADRIYVGTKAGRA